MRRSFPTELFLARAPYGPLRVIVEYHSEDGDRRATILTNPDGYFVEMIAGLKKEKWNKVKMSREIRCLNIAYDKAEDWIYYRDYNDTVFEIRNEITTTVKKDPNKFPPSGCSIIIGKKNEQYVNWGSE